MILVDEPRWPAHGTVFGHLVSDTDLDELHAFARRCGLSPRAFDHDHYDVPIARLDDLIDAGATLVGERELVRRLVASGLRVRARDKTPSRETALASAMESWAGLGLPAALRDELLLRWREPHRHYHDVRHLAHCLSSLDALGTRDPVVILAAWFHDAVYDGAPGDDEESSAALAEQRLHGLLPASDVADVAALVRMTATHRPDDPREALLSDADLSILGQIPGRYHVYVRDVRLDYAHLPEDQWRAGRRAVIDHLLALDPLFATQRGTMLWATAARRNLTAEIAALE